MRCKSCGKEGKERGNAFCSNECFRTGREKRPPSCPICNGTNSAASLCTKHRRALYNKGWKPKPARERGGFDMDTFSVDDAGGLPIGERSPTELAISIVRLVAAGIPYEDIATDLRCSLVYVKKVSIQWTQKTKGALKRVRRINVMRNKLH